MISHSIFLVRTETGKKTLENWRTAKKSNNLKKIFWDMTISVKKKTGETELSAMVKISPQK